MPLASVLATAWLVIATRSFDVSMLDDALLAAATMLGAVAAWRRTLRLNPRRAQVGRG